MVGYARGSALAVSLALTIAGGSAAISGHSASAQTFPGGNGKIVIGLDPDGSDNGAPHDQIYVMEPDGSNPTRLTFNEAHDYDAAWSPEGTRIAFSSNRDVNHEIYVMAADGSNQTRLTDSGGTSPTWSPDGSKIAFTKAAAVWIMNADGSDPFQLTPDEYLASSPEWSPDGTQIVFSGGLIPPSNSAIHVVRVDDGSNITPLTDSTVERRLPAWSPDGTRIAFARGGLDGGIFVIGADGSNETRLSESHLDFEPIWSPDNRYIAFTSYRHTLDINPDVYRMDFDGSNVVRLTTAPLGQVGAYAYSWQRTITSPTTTTTTPLPDPVAPSTSNPPPSAVAPVSSLPGTGQSGQAGIGLLALCFVALGALTLRAARRQ